ATTRGEINGWCIPVVVGLIALIAAWVLPLERIAWSGWIYFSMAILVPLHSNFRRRRIRRIA
ncbi:MAG TPA: hypothetical protein VF551_08300, partial [Chthoniobacterales bacterium]